MVLAPAPRQVMGLRDLETGCRIENCTVYTAIVVVVMVGQSGLFGAEIREYCEVFCIRRVEEMMELNLGVRI